MSQSLQIATVSGLPGSGTTTASRLLSERLGWHYINAGQIFRQMAVEAGLSLAAFGQQAEADGRIDRQLDERMVERARTEAPVVLEGRVSGWMARRHGLPALKVWLEAPAKVRAERVGQRDGQSREEALAAMLEREASEKKRYAEHHGIAIGDLSVYDLVVDTGRTSAEEAVALIAARLREEGA